MGKKEEENRIILPFFWWVDLWFKLVGFLLHLYIPCVWLSEAADLLDYNAVPSTDAIQLLSYGTQLLPKKQLRWWKSNFRKWQTGKQRKWQLETYIPSHSNLRIWHSGLASSGREQKREVVTSRCHGSKISRWQQAKKSLKVHSHYFKLHRSYPNSFNLANLGEIFFGTVSIVI